MNEMEVTPRMLVNNFLFLCLQHSEDHESTYKNFEEEDDDFLDDSFDVSRESFHSGKQYPIKCVALYTFQVQL